VPQSRYASDDWYDVWLPELAPSQSLVAFAQERGSKDWPRFEKRYRAEMRRPAAARLLQLLAALSPHTSFSVGCYCEDEHRCHRSILRELLREQGARIGP
jgi:uncharacterized protein YeaO (DUF488 family)